MPYVNQQGKVNWGDQQPDEVEIPERPSARHEFINGAWALDTERYKTDRIVQLQSAYESDLEKLNKAWLAALIADGVGEAARQAALKIQMQDLADQLDLDILTIIMEE